ncbi:MAG: glycoside hydrolase family 43 protein [Muribaculaceae bacterium]|nr:glycoside hydrolase family 43 protein [Muribaculaceae bacterium]
MIKRITAGSFLLAFSVALCSADIPVIKGELWPDTDGKHINCHGGCIIQGPDSIYYWYGEHRGFNAPQEGVACYTSTDLRTWSNRGIVMPVSDSSDAIVERGSVIERPKVVYCPATGRYVMWFHHELKGRGYEAAQAGVAVADNPLGPFVPLSSSRVNAGILPQNIGSAKAPSADDLAMEWWTPEWYAKVDDGMFTYRDLEGGQMARDMTLFVDDDGTAYHIYSSEDNLTLQIAELDSTYTRHTGRYVRIFPGGHNEAPAIFKHEGKYWMICSGCTGWAPNEARLMWADSLTGEWHKLPNPCRGEGAELTFGGQSTYILKDSDGSITFMADIWNPKSLPESRHLWLPVSFDKDGTPYISNEAESSL